MITNKIFKKILKSTVFKGLNLLNKFTFKRNQILIYSNNSEVRDNLLYVQNYLIEKNYDAFFKILVSTPRKYIDKRIKFKYKKITNFRAIFSFLHSKYVFYAFGQIPIYPTKRQIVVHLTHGMFFKTDGNLNKQNKNFEKNNYFTYVLSTSSFYIKYFVDGWGCNEKQILINPLPRTMPLNNKLIMEDNLVFWAPTFRTSKYLHMKDSHSESLLPIFGNDFVKLDKLCIRYGIHMIVKLHPFQDLDNYRNYIGKGVEIYSNSDFTLKFPELYQFLPKTSALITDYSSVFIDYLLLDRKIAFTCDDFESYDSTRGLLFKDDERFDIGDKISNVEQFESFLKDLNIDNYKQKREKLNLLLNQEYCLDPINRLFDLINLKKGN